MRNKDILLLRFRIPKPNYIIILINRTDILLEKYHLLNKQKILNKKQLIYYKCF